MVMSYFVLSRVRLRFEIVIFTFQTNNNGNLFIMRIIRILVLVVRKVYKELVHRCVLIICSEKGSALPNGFTRLNNEYESPEHTREKKLSNSQKPIYFSLWRETILRLNSTEMSFVYENKLYIPSKRRH